MEALRCWSESASWGTSSCRRRLRLRKRNRRRRARPRVTRDLARSLSNRSSRAELLSDFRSAGFPRNRGAPELNENGDICSQHLQSCKRRGHFTCPYVSLTRFLLSFRVARDTLTVEQHFVRTAS